MRFYLRLLVAFTVFAASASVYSQVYLGASVGVSEPVDATDGELLPEFESDTALRGFVGNRLSPKFAVELAYTSFGEYEVEDAEGLGFVENTLALSGVDASVLGKLPLAKRLSVFGRLGLFYWNAERTTIDSDGVVSLTTADELDYMLGFGVEVRAFNHFGVTLDTNAYVTDDVYNLVYALSAYYNF